MRWVQVGGTDWLECEACSGTWLESTTFERLCADRESQAAALHGASQPAAAPNKTVETVHYRPCLRCGKLMNRMNFGRLSGTIVDVCRWHGTFLDRGELHQVVQFILDGGLDRARKVELERLVEEQRRLRDLERAAASPAASSSGWTSSSLEEFLAALVDRPPR